MMRFLALLAFLCSFALMGSAQVVRTNGCYEAATGRIYVGGNSCGHYLVVCNGTDPNNEFALRVNPTNTNCSACKPNILGPFTVFGKLTNYTIYQCPLDGGVITLALLSTAIGLYFLRLRKIHLLY
jgi:hypothetical protein